MTYTPLQLDIIKRFGKKELSFGSLLNIHSRGIRHIESGGYIDEVTSSENNLGIYINTEGGDDFIFYYILDKSTFQFKKFGECGEGNTYEILGNIPHLEDVFRVAKEKGWTFVMNNDIDDWLCFANNKFNYDGIHYDATLPLLDQPESTLQELLSLFPNQ